VLPRDIVKIYLIVYVIIIVQAQIDDLPQAIADQLQSQTTSWVSRWRSSQASRRACDGWSFKHCLLIIASVAAAACDTDCTSAQRVTISSL